MKTRRCRYKRQTQKQQRRYNRSSCRRRGGRIIGQGVFGCVTDPPIPCRNAPTNRPYVTKLYNPHLNDPDFITNSVYITEFDKAQEMRRRIPDIDTYMVLPVFECDIDYDEAKTHQNYRNCLAQSTNSPTTIVYSPRATGDLAQLAKQPDILAAMTNQNRLVEIAKLLHGLALLHAAKILLNDVHMGNIFYEHDPATGYVQLKLADIGLALFDVPEPNATAWARADVKRLGVSVGNAGLTRPFESDPTFSAFFRQLRNGSYVRAQQAYSRLVELA